MSPEYRYIVTGTYIEESRSMKLQPGDGAWISKHPADETAKTLVGRLTVDGEFFQGQV